MGVSAWEYPQIFQAEEMSSRVQAGPLAIVSFFGAWEVWKKDDLMGFHRDRITKHYTIGLIKDENKEENLRMSWGNPWFAVDFPTNPLIATIFETNPLVIWRGPGQTGNRRCRKDRKSYGHPWGKPTYFHGGFSMFFW